MQKIQNIAFEVLAGVRRECCGVGGSKYKILEIQYYSRRNTKKEKRNTKCKIRNIAFGVLAGVGRECCGSVWLKIQNDRNTM